MEFNKYINEEIDRLKDKIVTEYKDTHRSAEIVGHIKALQFIQDTVEGYKNAL